MLNVYIIVLDTTQSTVMYDRYIRKWISLQI